MYLDRQLSQYNRLNARVATLREQIGVKQTLLESLVEAQQNPILLEHDVWETERRYFSGVVKGLEEVVDNVNKAFDSIELAPISIQAPEKYFDEAAINYVYEKAGEVSSSTNNARESLITDMQKIKVLISEYLQNWKSNHAQHIRDYESLKKNLGDSSSQHLASELEILNGQESEVSSKLAKLDALKEKEDDLKEERQNVLVELGEIRAIKRTKRELQIEKIKAEIGPVMSIGLKESGDRAAYLKELGQHLTGSNAQNPLKNDIVNALEPDELAALVQKNEVDKLGQMGGIGADWSKRIIDHLSSKPEALFKIQEIICDDFLDVRLRVAADNHRELNKLSAGQKATVIILLALIDGSHPVLFDQPEDSLDTAFIFKDVVRMLREAKIRRQFILATHNSNISISSHLDQGIVLDVNETAERTLITGAGSLDNEETKSLLILHLEGGQEAFSMRGRKYNLPSS